MDRLLAAPRGGRRLPEAASDLAAFADSVLVCVTPAAPPAPVTDVVVTTLADGEQVLVETLSADGLEHTVDQTECRGRPAHHVVG